VADDTELAKLYGFPENLDRPWVKVNFISSADGAVSVSGRSAGLSDENDKKVFLLGRKLADVVLVGAGTALVERYRGVQRDEVPDDWRVAHGLTPVPPVAVVTRRCSIDPTSGLLTDTQVPPIILTTEAAPERRRAALVDAGAEVIIAGERDVDPKAALDVLDAKGFRRVCCEGGPQLFGSLIAADLVDELCLSVAPVLTGGDARRIAVGPAPDAPVRLKLASVLHADNLLMLRYLRD
jgi:5-amino-6-(5-phosphoribosylamino)uracil reductase